MRRNRLIDNLWFTYYATHKSLDQTHWVSECRRILTSAPLAIILIIYDSLSVNDLTGSAFQIIYQEARFLLRGLINLRSYLNYIRFYPYKYLKKHFGYVSPGNWTWHWLKWTRRVIKRWNLILWAIVTCTSFKILRLLFSMSRFLFFCSLFFIKNVRCSHQRIKKEIEVFVTNSELPYQLKLGLHRLRLFIDGQLFK